MAVEYAEEIEEQVSEEKEMSVKSNVISFELYYMFKNLPPEELMKRVTFAPGAVISNEEVSAILQREEEEDEEERVKRLERYSQPAGFYYLYTDSKTGDFMVDYKFFDADGLSLEDVYNIEQGNCYLSFEDAQESINKFFAGKSFSSETCRFHPLSTSVRKVVFPYDDFYNFEV